MKYIITFVFLHLKTLGIYAQKELSLHFLPNVIQSNFTNPSFFVSNKKLVVLPSAFYNLYTPDFTLKKLFGLNARGVRNINEIAETVIGERNRFAINFNATTFGYSYSPLPSWHFTISHAYNARLVGDIDGILIKAFTNDYEKYLGKSIPFDATINGNVHHQLAFVAAYEYNQNLNFGARLKILKGIAGAFTRSIRSKVTIIDYNYATTYNNDINIFAYNIDNIGDLKNVGGLLKHSLNLHNLGIGLDLGITYKKDKWQLSASVLDVPSIIFWKKEGKNYIGNGFTRFNGIGGSIGLFNPNRSRSFSVKDTITKILSLTNIENPSYSEVFPTQTYLSASYKWSEKWLFGVLLHNEINAKIVSKTDILLNATYKVLNNVDLGSTWSLRNKRFDNFGLYGVGHYKKIQLYALTENIYTAFNAPKHKAASARIGFNLLLP